jgi:hypothetical protein
LGFRNFVLEMVRMKMGDGATIDVLYMYMHLLKK